MFCFIVLYALGTDENGPGTLKKNWLLKVFEGTIGVTYKYRLEVKHQSLWVL